MEGFCKQEDCPTSEELAALNAGHARSYTDQLERHLAECEFCAAEAEFYRLYPPPVEEDVRPEEMPRALFELAEALLQKKNDLTPLYKLVGRDD